MVSDICSILTTFGNAALSFESSSRASLSELYVFTFFWYSQGLIPLSASSNENIMRNPKTILLNKGYNFELLLWFQQ